ncbi:hypothetical protein QE152_g13782 [Popillia japonica]|uniref:Uncharacterized protein n=1 Tax=Popillia japonica TaxID=7064 RepID=A0AAW1L9Z3_POPJA
MEHLVDETILSTPKPCASSTIERKQFLRKIDKKYGTKAKYHSLCEDNETFSGDDSITTQLQIQRKLAHNALEKSRIGLPAKFLVPSDIAPCTIKKTCNSSTVNESDLLKSQASAIRGSITIKKTCNSSTVNESDLLKSQASAIRGSITCDDFAPADISTPKHSNGSQASEQPYRSLSDVIDEASKRIRNSDINLQDVCSELSGLSMGRSCISKVDSRMFVPAELMEEKLLEDEMSWRQKRDLPRSLKNISDLSVSVIKGVKKDTEHSSVMSATQIYKILSECGPEDPQQILNRLTRKTKEITMNESLMSEKESVMSERDVDEYILANKSGKNENTRSNIDKNVNLPCIMTTSPTFVWDNVQKQPSTYNKFCQNLEPEQKSQTGLVNSLNVSPNLPSTICKSSSHIATSNMNSADAQYSDVFNRNTLHVPNSEVNSPIENKENISDNDRSLTSVRSGSSLDIPEGKFPIKSNRLELIWGCLKIGRTSVQQFQIKNQLNQRIRMQATITGSTFRIVKDSEMLTVTTFVLRPFEIKSFTIVFCPTKIGAAVEKINFYPVIGGETQHFKRQVLTLFGYGGHISCDIGNIMKDSGGKLWLSLGKIDYQTYGEQKFVIKNTGNLLAFAYMDVVSKGAVTYSDINIDPKQFIINPQEEAIVTVRYRPSKQELKHLQKVDIVEVGHIKLITGAEATRGRLRRLYSKLQHKNTPVDPLVKNLCGIFSGETLPADLRYFKESVSAVKELLSHLSVKEITVTIEQDLENTLVNPMIDMNETQDLENTLVNPMIDMNETTMYHTLQQDDEDLVEYGNVTAIKRDHQRLFTITMYHTLQQDDEDLVEYGNVTAIKRDHQRLFTIEPTSILFTLPMKQEDTILTITHCYFIRLRYVHSTSCNPNDDDYA